MNFTIEMTKGFFDFLDAPVAIAVDLVNGGDRNDVFLLRRRRCRRNLVTSTILFSLFMNQTKKKKQNSINLGAKFCKFNTLKKRKKNNEDPI